MSSYQHSVAELEATEKVTQESQIEGWRERDQEVWHFLVDGSYRAQRRAEDAKAREAARPKPKPEQAAQVPREQRLVTRGSLDKIMGAVGKFVRTQVSESAGRLASATRVAELTERVTALEARLAASEARAAKTDIQLSETRRHTQNLETRTNNLTRELKGLPPEGKIERAPNLNKS